MARTVKIDRQHHADFDREHHGIFPLNVGPEHDECLLQRRLKQFGGEQPGAATCPASQLELLWRWAFDKRRHVNFLWHGIDLSWHGFS